MATPDPAWTTELNLAENDALRQAGDIDGIQVKYNATTGTVTYSDAPWGAFNTVVGDDWFVNLSNPNKNSVMSTVDASGNVTLSQPGTISTLNPLLSVDQENAAAVAFGVAQRLWQERGLPTPSRDLIRIVLENITDTPQYANIQKYNTIVSIRSKNKLLNTTSLTNLQTIDSLLGV
jgi:hypothetical protein